MISLGSTLGMNKLIEKIKVHMPTDEYFDTQIKYIRTILNGVLYLISKTYKLHADDKYIGEEIDNFIDDNKQKIIEYFVKPFLYDKNEGLIYQFLNLIISLCVVPFIFRNKQNNEDINKNIKNPNVDLFWQLGQEKDLSSISEENINRIYKSNLVKSQINEFINNSINEKDISQEDVNRIYKSNLVKSHINSLNNNVVTQINPSVAEFNPLAAQFNPSVAQFNPSSGTKFNTASGRQCNPLGKKCNCFIEKEINSPQNDKDKYLSLFYTYQLNDQINSLIEK
jgi:hypothetical protein